MGFGARKGPSAWVFATRKLQLAAALSVLWTPFYICSHAMGGQKEA